MRQIPPVQTASTASYTSPYLIYGISDYNPTIVTGKIVKLDILSVFKIPSIIGLFDDLLVFRIATNFLLPCGAGLKPTCLFSYSEAFHLL